MKAILTDHARMRLQERTTLSEQDFVTLLNAYQTVSAGYDWQRNCWHRLFFSRADDRHFVAIQDISNGAVITVLPIDYHENLAWKISDKKLKKAIWKIDSDRHAELYTPQPSTNNRKFEMTGVFWSDGVNRVKKNLGSFRFSALPNSPEDVVTNESLIETILTRLQSRKLNLLSLDEVILYEQRTDTFYKLPWDRISDFSLESDKNKESVT